VTNFFNASRDAAGADRHRELLMALQNPTLVHGYIYKFLERSTLGGYSKTRRPSLGNILKTFLTRAQVKRGGYRFPGPIGFIAIKWPTKTITATTFIKTPEQQ
jgi:hypothetical protein